MSASRTIVLGTSYTFHFWDANKEKFVYAKAAEGRRGYLIVDGKDEVICQRCAFKLAILRFKCVSFAEWSSMFKTVCDNEVGMFETGQ